MCSLIYALLISITKYTCIYDWVQIIYMTLYTVYTCMCMYMAYLFEYPQVEELLEFLVAVVDTELLKAVHLKVL